MKYSKDIVDSSGIQFVVTPKLRPIEVGVFVVAAEPHWPGIIIPPGQDSFPMKFYANSKCLNV